jgi:hypothetical protein
LEIINGCVYAENHEDEHDIGYAKQRKIARSSIVICCFARRPKIRQMD